VGLPNCQQKSHGGVGVLAKMSRDIFFFVISLVKVSKRLCHVTQRSVEGGGGGSKKCGKVSRII
jgi:hypothetical protein